MPQPTAIKIVKPQLENIVIKQVELELIRIKQAQ